MCSPDQLLQHTFSSRFVSEWLGGVTLVRWVGRSSSWEREGVRHLLARRKDPNLPFLPPRRGPPGQPPLPSSHLSLCAVGRKLGREQWNFVLCNSVPLDHSY